MIKSKILIVEDEKVTLEILKITLENLGYEVTGLASSADSFHQSIQKTLPDIVLMDIYLNENKNEDALKAADDALVQYPNSLIFIFGRANALFKLKKYIESEAAYRKALSFLDLSPNDNRAAMAFCHFWIAKNDFYLERFDECLLECDRMKTYGLTDDNKKLMQKYFAEIEGIRKQAMSGRKSRS